MLLNNLATKRIKLYKNQKQCSLSMRYIKQQNICVIGAPEGIEKQNDLENPYSGTIA